MTARQFLLVIILFCTGILFSSISASAQYHLHVGESKFLAVPDPPMNGVIEHSVWTRSNGIVIDSDDNTVGAIIRIAHYFEETGSVEVTYTYTYYDSQMRPRAGQGYKYWSITCVPIYVSLDQTDVSLKVGKKESLKTSYPSSAAGWMTGVDFVWESSDDSIVSVEKQPGNNARITGLHYGNATITLDPIVGPAVYCRVTVVADPPTAVALSPETLDLVEGEKGRFSCVLTPKDAYAELRWSSSDQNVATVNSAGLITAVSEGTSVITVTTDNGLTATATVAVIPLPKEVRLEANYSVMSGYSFQLKPSVYPENSSVSFEWSSEDSRIASVDASGRVTGRKPGTVTLNVKTQNGCTASTRITVQKADKGKDVRTVKQRISILRGLVDQSSLQ